MKLMHYDGARAVISAYVDPWTVLLTETTRILPSATIRVDDGDRFPNLSRFGSASGVERILADADPAKVAASLARDLGARELATREEFDREHAKVQACVRLTAWTPEEHRAALSEGGVRKVLAVRPTTLDGLVHHVRHAKSVERDMNELRAALRAMPSPDLLALGRRVLDEMDRCEDPTHAALARFEAKRPDSRSVLIDEVAQAFFMRDGLDDRASVAFHDAVRAAIAGCLHAPEEAPSLAP